ncbi:MAG: DUF167 domain-containing protein [Phycisphaerales bacterium]
MTPIVQPVTGPNGTWLGVRVAVKAVPGASRDAIAGPLGDRLKVRVAAPPEGGKANKAIEALLADTCGLPPRDVAVIAGHTRPEKTVELRGIDVVAACTRLGLAT